MKDGELLPYFLTVMDRPDDPDGATPELREIELALAEELDPVRHDRGSLADFAGDAPPSPALPPQAALAPVPAMR